MLIPSRKGAKQMPNEINPETILSTTEKPLTLLRWLRAIQKTNAQITEKLTELENTLNGKVAKAGDTMTGDLSVPNINVNNNANVGKLNTEKINQKYVGAIKSELHVDEQGIVEFVNGSNAGRFDTAKVIKPSEVKTEIYDNQEGKRMFFRLPYLEASAGEHRLLTEEDLGGGGSSLLEDIEDADGHKAFEMYSQDEAPEDTFPLYVKAIRNGYTLTLICCTRVINAQNVTKNIGYIKLPSYILDKLILGQYEGSTIGYNYSGIYAGGSTTLVGTTWTKVNDGIKIFISGLSAFSGGNVRATLSLGL